MSSGAFYKTLYLIVNIFTLAFYRKERQQQYHNYFLEDAVQVWTCDALRGALYLLVTSCPSFPVDVGASSRVGD